MTRADRRFITWSAIATAVGITTSYASLRYGPIAALGPFGFGGLLIWHGHHHPEDNT